MREKKSKRRLFRFLSVKKSKTQISILGAQKPKKSVAPSGNENDDQIGN